MKRNVVKIVGLVRRAVIVSLLLSLFSSAGVLGYEPTESDGRPGVGGGDRVAPLTVQGPQTVYEYPLSVGVEYIADYPGTANDLPCSANNAYGVYNTLRSSAWFGGASSFIWGNGNAWEQDFKATTAPGGGNKNNWIDNVDLAFYEGHGNPTLFTFETPTGGGTHDDSYLTYNDVNTRLGYRGWGSNDLEWLGLLSCSVLADSHEMDWSYSMDYLHLLMGFATTAYDVCGFGQTFAQRVLAGNSLRDAWFIACDQKQPSGVQAKVLGEEYYDLYESIYNQMPDHAQDATYWRSTKWCGTTQPALYVDPQQVTAMPVLLTPPLSFAEATSRWDNLGATFGVPTQTATLATMAPLAQGGVWTSTLGTHQLEMDSVSGLFYYVDSGALFSGTAASQVGILSAQDAKATADAFLNGNKLMPGDAQFAEAVPVNLDTIQKPPPGLKSPSAPVVITSTVTDWEVIYSRIVTGTTTGLAPTQAISFSVVGDGAKLKVYVKPTGGAARVATPEQTGAVVGAQGGWRQVGSVSALSPQKMTAVQPYDKIEKLFQIMEPQTAYKHVPFDNPTNKTVLTYTLGYWEESTGSGQDQLYPAYIISATYEGSTPDPLVVTGTTYMPIDPEFMPPLAKVQSTSDLGKNLWPGQVITLSAADASKTLAELGYDASLDFKLGVGNTLPPNYGYTYEWYRGSVADGNLIGSGRNLNYTVTLSGDSWQAAPVPQTIYLRVRDIGSSHTSRQTSLATAQVNIMPPVYLPLVIRGQ